VEPLPWQGTWRVLRVVLFEIKTEDSRRIANLETRYISLNQRASNDDGRTDKTFIICCAVNKHNSQTVPSDCSSSSSPAAISATERHVFGARYAHELSKTAFVVHVQCAAF
jgi:hypothetical protein